MLEISNGKISLS